MHFFFIIIIFFFSSNVLSHHKIYSPRVEEGRQSFEWRGHFDSDTSIEKDKAHHHVLETEYSWTNFWQSELEFHISDKSDTTLDWEKTEFQNQVQIFDFNNFAGALYFSYNFVSEKDEEDEIEYKYLNDIVINNISLTSNFIFEKQVGSDAKKSTEFAFSNYLKFQNFLPYEIDFGVFGFSEFGEISGFEVFDEQTHQYGLQFEKELHINDIEFEFALGWLHGFTNASAEQTFIWNLEVEFN